MGVLTPREVKALKHCPECGSAVVPVPTASKASRVARGTLFADPFALLGLQGPAPGKKCTSCGWQVA